MPTNLPEAQKDFINRAISFAQIMAYYGVPVKFHSYFRSFDEQNRLFSEGHTKARGGQSPHNYGLGADYNFERYGWDVPKSWWEFGDAVANYVGLESGLAWEDANHIQLRGWKAWKV